MFEVGEIATFVWVSGELEGNIRSYIGQDVEIIGPPIQYDKSKYPLPMYSLVASDGMKFYATENNLRKKDYGEPNTKITWDDMPYWKPRELIRV